MIVLKDAVSTERRDPPFGSGFGGNDKNPPWTPCLAPHEVLRRCIVGVVGFSPLVVLVGNIVSRPGTGAQDLS